MDTISKKLNVHFMPGDGKGWALDEDRKQMRLMLQGIVHESSLARADVIHTPFWQGLSSVAPEILEKTFVIAQADNPPFFYFKQPDFLWGQRVVDLWIARSQEALEQFHTLKLPVKYVPYFIDATTFFPIADKKLLRKKFGIPEGAYVIANFHRDTEGCDLKTPKFQKAPELMVAIFKGLQQRGIAFHVLLAGPRRHWLRKALQQANIPFTFVGDGSIQGDDFGKNILNRATLNELTNAADLYLIPSRWEGGPHSVMEAVLCQCKVLSTPLGVAKDILEPVSLYRSVSEAVNVITDDQQHDLLRTTVQPQWERWQNMTTATIAEFYQQLPDDPIFQKKVRGKRTFSFQYHQIIHVLKRWLKHFRNNPLPQEVGWNHQLGKSRDLDEILLGVSRALRLLGIKQRPATGQGIEIIGWPTTDLPCVKKGCQRLQWIVPQLTPILKEAALVVPAVQDVINFRSSGVLNTMLVMPFPLSGKGISKEPFVVEKGNRFASTEIWRAMAAGCPIVYPEDSAYYEQVFHGGLCYQREEDLPTVLQAARDTALELCSLARPPAFKDACQALKASITILNTQ